MLDALVWSCRPSGSAAATIPYRALMKLTHSARGTIAAALRSLVRCGFILKTRRRVRIGWQTLQATNRYTFVVRSESNPQTSIQVERVEYLRASVPDGSLDAARAALAHRRAVTEARMLARRRGGGDLARAA